MVTHLHDNKRIRFVFCMVTHSLFPPPLLLSVIFVLYLFAPLCISVHIPWKAFHAWAKCVCLFSSIPRCPPHGPRSSKDLPQFAPMHLWTHVLGLLCLKSPSVWHKAAVKVLYIFLLYMVLTLLNVCTGREKHRHYQTGKTQPWLRSLSLVCMHNVWHLTFAGNCQSASHLPPVTVTQHQSTWETIKLNGKMPEDEME